MAGQLRTIRSLPAAPVALFARLMKPRPIYRFAATIAGLLVFLGMSCLYAFGDRNLYEDILTSYGIGPFRFPFVDISGALAAWECARQGLDVILSDPCDVLRRGYNYSPLWMAASPIPLGVRDTTVVGWILDLVFLMSLSFLPSPRCLRELILVLAATLSTMVIFALERANPDVLLFMLALAAGALAECRLFLRLLGYFVALIAALLKYYPIMVLIIVFRERVSILVAIGSAVVVSLALFWVEYHTEVARGLPTIARGAYNTDLFAAKNLPFLLGEAAGSAAEFSGWAPFAQSIVAGGLYAILVGSSVAICRRLLSSGELRGALASLTRPERLFLVIGSAVIAGCFFAGQSVGYRGVYFLLALPGLLAISRSSSRDIRNLSLGTSVIIVLLMWGECFRLALYRALDHSSVPEVLAGTLKVQFWLLRELGWWWTISFMLTVLVDFLWASPITYWVSSRFRHSRVVSGDQACFPAAEGMNRFASIKSARHPPATGSRAPGS